MRCDSRKSPVSDEASLLRMGQGPWPIGVNTRGTELPMEASNADVLGPVDWLVVEFPADKANFSGEMALLNN